MQDRSQRRVLPHSFLGSQEPETSAPAFMSGFTGARDECYKHSGFGLTGARDDHSKHSFLGPQEPETSVPAFSSGFTGARDEIETIAPSIQVWVHWSQRRVLQIVFDVAVRCSMIDVRDRTIPMSPARCRTPGRRDGYIARSTRSSAMQEYPCQV